MDNAFRKWAFLSGVVLAFALPVAGQVRQAALRLHPENPHYFLFRKEPTIVITSAEHYGAVLHRDKRPSPIPVANGHSNCPNPRSRWAFNAQIEPQVLNLASCVEAATLPRCREASGCCAERVFGVATNRGALVGHVSPARARIFPVVR